MSAGSLTRSDLIGHADQIAALRRLVAKDAVPHAILINGPENSGKTKVARLFSADLTCTESSESGQACGKCRSCELHAAGSHPDILTVTPVKEETTIGQVRNLRYTANLAPSLSNRRIIIIEQAETLNDMASNAILKALEDAPEPLVMLLLAPSARSVLPTIRSRSMQIALKPVPITLITEALLEMGIDEENASSIATFSGGAPGKAIRLAEDAELFVALKRAADWADLLHTSRPSRMLWMSSEIQSIAGDAKKRLGDDESGSSDRQAISWALDGALARIQEKLNGEPGAEALKFYSTAAREINIARTLILQYAQTDLMLERMLLRTYGLIDAA